MAVFKILFIFSLCFAFYSYGIKSLPLEMEENMGAAEDVADEEATNEGEDDYSDEMDAGGDEIEDDDSDEMMDQVSEEGDDFTKRHKLAKYPAHNLPTEPAPRAMAGHHHRKLAPTPKLPQRPLGSSQRQHVRPKQQNKKTKPKQ